MTIGFMILFRGIVQKMITHNELKKSLRNKYPWSHWILLNEVRDASGYEGNRSIDAVAFGLYASRGYEVHAFECKAHRTDWLSELRQPDKADEFATIADKFWIVASKGVVKKEELPKGWGLILVSRKGDDFVTRIVVQAEMSEQRDLPRPFVASMLTKLRKKIEKYQRESVLKSEIYDQIKEAQEQGREWGKRSSDWDKKDYDVLKKIVEDFEEASGIRLNTFKGADVIGKEVALARSLFSIGKDQGLINRAKGFAGKLRGFADSIEEKAEKLSIVCEEMTNTDEEL